MKTEKWYYQINDSGKSDFPLEVNNEKETIAFLNTESGSRQIPIAEQLQRAKLMVAAPKMLMELQSVRKDLNTIVDMLINGITPSDESVNNLINNIDITIKKAIS